MEGQFPFDVRRLLWINVSFTHNPYEVLNMAG